MDITTFLATRQPVSDEVWRMLQDEDVTYDQPREAFFMYGEGNEWYVLHEKDGGYFPHAWWYTPARKESLIEAETVLWNWRAEFH